MKVGDLVRRIGHLPSEVFLVVRTGKTRPEQWNNFRDQVMWLYPDPHGACDHTVEGNYYYKHDFEVVSESRRSGKGTW